MFLILFFHSKEFNTIFISIARMSAMSQKSAFSLTYFARTLLESRSKVWKSFKTYYVDSLFIGNRLEFEPKANIWAIYQYGWIIIFQVWIFTNYFTDLIFILSVRIRLYNLYRYVNNSNKSSKSQWKSPVEIAR